MSDGLSCTTKTSKYGAVIARCKCLQKKHGCSNYCHCINCGNPHGQHKHSDEGPQRKCVRHTWQKATKKSVTFAEQRKEVINTGPLTVLEFFILEYILDYCEQQGIEEARENILLIYNAIVSTSRTFDETLPITSKTEKDIGSFLVNHEHNLAAFQSKCKMQMNFV